MATRIYLSSAFTSLGGFLFGYHTGVISGVLTMSAFTSKFNLTDSKGSIDSAKNGGIVGVFLFGCFIGSLLSGQTSDRFSRKFSIIGSSILFVISGILQTTVPNLGSLLFARLIAGISIGALSQIIPVYQSEISTKELRGRIVSFQQLSITFGIATSYWINYGSINAFEKSNGSWELPLAFQIVPGLILSIGMIRFAHSPRWLVTQDREEEAFNVLLRFRNNDQNKTRIELNEIIGEVAEQRENELEKYSQLFNKRFRRRIVLAIFIQIFDQLTGINSIIYYSPIIFQQAKLINKDHQELLITALIGSVNFLSTIPSVIFIDRFGRRFILILGSILMTISMILIGILMASCGDMDKSFVVHVGASYGIIVFVFIFIIGFASSWGPIAWIYCAEIFPISMRSKATSITTATHWIVNCTIAFCVPFILDSSYPYLLFFFFGCFCILMGLSVYFFYPETKGNSLEEMDFIFNSSSSLMNNQSL